MADYTNTGLVAAVKLLGFFSATTDLGDAQILQMAEYSLNSYMVPFLKAARDEWQVGKTDLVLTSDANSQVTLPDSVGSTLRTVAWMNNGILTPLARIEPENSFQYLANNSSIPVGFMLRGYTLELLPHVPATQVHVTYMERQPSLVLNTDAGLVSEIVDYPGDSTVQATLSSVPLSWQSTPPTQVDLISSAGPHSKLCTCAVNTFDAPTKAITFQSVDGTILQPQVVAGWWVADVGSSPYTNLPVELFPLLVLDVICTIYIGTSDKRLQAMEQRKVEEEKKLLKLLTPRTQGQVQPIVNGNVPGGRNFGYRRGY